MRFWICWLELSFDLSLQVGNMSEFNFYFLFWMWISYFTKLSLYLLLDFPLNICVLSLFKASETKGDSRPITLMESKLKIIGSFSLIHCWKKVASLLTVFQTLWFKTRVRFYLLPEKNLALCFQPDWSTLSNFQTCYFLLLYFCLTWLSTWYPLCFSWLLPLRPFFSFLLCMYCPYFTL